MPRSSLRSSIASFCAWACLMEVLLKSNSFSVSIVSCAAAVMGTKDNNTNSRKAFIAPPEFSSPEDISNFIDQSFILQILALNFRQLLQQLSLFACQAGGCNQGDGNEEITTPAAAENWHPFSAQPKHGAGLGAHRNLQLLVLVERLNHNLGAQRRLRESDRHRLVKVITLSLKLVMFGNVDNHVQVSR